MYLISCVLLLRSIRMVKVLQEKAGDSSDEAEEVREVLVDSIF